MVLYVLPLGVVPALSATVFTSFAMSSIRRMANTEPSIAIVFYFTLTCTIFSSLTLPFDFVMTDPLDAVLRVMIGLLGGFGQALLTSSYRLAPALSLAPFDYTARLLALLLGFFVFAAVQGGTASGW